MVRSLYSGVSGLKSHQTRMDVIGNNIANVNTYGFKASRTSFSDIYYQYQRTETAGRTTYAGNNPSQVGYGVQVASIDKDMSMSSFQNTGRTLDLAIAGDGFFMCATKDRNDQINSVNYTRMGNFGIDSVGNLVNANNEFILGTINVDRLSGGDYSTNLMIDQEPADTPNELDDINVNDLVWDAFKPECQIEFDDVSNLYKTPEGANKVGKTADNPGTPLITIFSGENPYDNTKQIAYDYHMAAAIEAKDGQYNAVTTTPVNIAAERGEGVILSGITYPETIGADTVNFRSDNEILSNKDVFYNQETNSYADTSFTVTSDYILYSVNGKFVNQQGVVYDPDVGLYTDEEGNYYEYTCSTQLNDDGTLNKTHTYTRMRLNAEGKYEEDPTVQDFTYDQITDTYQTRDASGNTIYANMTDGSLKYSDLDGFTVGSDGVLTAQYASEMRSLARIELATFDNVEGLTEIGDTAFAQSPASGEVNIKRPGDSGAGEVQSSKLEMSNVNLANEFSDMIVTQRGYQANARIITTSDSMLEELVNLKR